MMEEKLEDRNNETRPIKDGPPAISHQSSSTEPVPRRVKTFNDPKLKHPNNTTFKQAHLSAHTLNVTSACLAIGYVVMGIVFIVIGALCYYVSNGVEQTYHRYDVECLNVPTCVVDIPITTSMKAPLFVYYQLDNFYQNVRSVVKSRDEKTINWFLIFGKRRELCTIGSL